MAPRHGRRPLEPLVSSNDLIAHARTCATAAEDSDAGRPWFDPRCRDSRTRPDDAARLSQAERNVSKSLLVTEISTDASVLEPWLPAKCGGRPPDEH